MISNNLPIDILPFLIEKLLSSVNSLRTLTLNFSANDIFDNDWIYIIKTIEEIINVFPAIKLTINLSEIRFSARNLYGLLEKKQVRYVIIFGYGNYDNSFFSELKSRKFLYKYIYVPENWLTRKTCELLSTLKDEDVTKILTTHRAFYGNMKEKEKEKLYYQHEDD